MHTFRLSDYPGGTEMHWSSVLYGVQFPMAPLGGLFVATVGVFILLGAVAPRQRMMLTYIGFGAGTLALILGGRLAVGLPRPTTIQVGSLALAIVLEIIAFVVAMPRLRPRGERAVMIATLAIVGIHFIVMTPAFGPLVGVLGILCAINAAVVWRRPSYQLSVAWTIDGLMKLGAGALLIATSPVF
jgi:hypothetical protein